MVMGDFGGPQLFMNNAQHNPVGLTYLPSDFLSLDLLQRPNGFGFSPGTSPAPNDVKNEAECFFSSQTRDLPISQSSYWAPNDSRYRSALKNPLYQPAFQQLAHQPSRLHIPSPMSKQKHGQLTPPSETTPTKESPLVETLQDSMINTMEQENGPTTRKRRSTQSSRITDASSHTTPTSRRRKKSARKQSSVGLAVEGDDKRSQFLERNRVAASKCRQKKKEWTSNLEQKARELQASKTSMALLVTSLREELLYLKGEALRHTTCDCNSVREYLARNAEASLPRGHLDHATSPHSSCSLSFDAMDLSSSIMGGSPNSSAMVDNQELPELSIAGQIPD
ncbi:hypothetical protein EPUS_02009 [Endocarpon pusillum Z07020]|uniref:BZIP domain-containing protein n=1 Tax=Endocarpon pusillum (strain Z07020 / HMAS-L-300199) TaxID=1263415 RepID=U1G9Z3_ENDPU|nr:uncharacterized protein EPUS_02009 [Endocarpon pusillum Z07020]ERF74322.1 hypothetical protein EPUS_02009 [Endocarpon pusillum Z07020]